MSACMEKAVHLAVAGDVFDSVLLCAVFFPEISWMRSWTELSQFLRIFRPTLQLKKTKNRNTSSK